MLDSRQLKAKDFLKIASIIRDRPKSHNPEHSGCGELKYPPKLPQTLTPARVNSDSKNRSSVNSAAAVGYIENTSQKTSRNL
ncbi:hypothetical protein QUB60_15940 [Microcoleus sp. A2-C5]|uniref:hypothetical protein n=1 Tax=unclassified Microcoleus TaxID=2642155 RepID=UPI002FD2E865